jgi:hypothetical protein
LKVAQRGTSLAASLIGLLALFPSVNAGMSDTKFCFAFPGSFRIDVDICVSALKSKSISLLSHATLYLRRDEAFLYGHAYDALNNQALLLNPYSSQAYALRGCV